MTAPGEVERRARQSGGSSDDAIYAAVRRALAARGARGTVLDVGCGSGRLRTFLDGIASRYVGVDVVRYEAFPPDGEFVTADLDAARVPLPAAAAEIVAAVEVIEHLENPRAFVRELVRLARPGGWVVVTTPNQLSWLSLGTLVVKHRFSQFQDSSYPAHRTAVLEVDLLRIAGECGLTHAATAFSLKGRIPLTGRSWPRAVAALGPRRFSDNILLVAQRPA